MRRTISGLSTVSGHCALNLFSEDYSFGVKVKELKEFSQEQAVDELPRPLKQKITDEILLKLRSLNASSNSSQQRG